MNNMTAPLTFTGSISPEARWRAEVLSTQQATRKKGEQVRLNTLSVSFVNFYLQCMGFETDLKSSDSWNPVQQTLLDVADLEVKNLGKLECRPVMEGTQVIYVPPEVMSNRIGYLAVEISQSFREATLLGFTQKVSTDWFSISQLQCLRTFHEYLENLSSIKPDKLASLGIVRRKHLVNLEQWFENIFEVGWQPIETLLGTYPANLSLNLRSTPQANVWQGKLIDLGVQHQNQSVVLVVSLSPEIDRKMDILVEVHPEKGQTYLPSNLQLMALDEEGATVMEAIARNSNSYMQLQFSGSFGERFSVKVVLGDVSAIENFVI